MKLSFLIPALIALTLFFAGCVQDPTVQANVYVYNERGQPVPNAYVYAYSNYNLGSGANSKWTNINGTLNTSTQTNQDGYASLNILPGNYAFTASTSDGLSGGAEKLIVSSNDSVYITVSSGGQPSTCGNGICEENENSETCPEDCITIEPFCGDGVCDETEDSYSCPSDCGVSGESFVVKAGDEITTSSGLIIGIEKVYVNSTTGVPAIDLTILLQIDKTNNTISGESMTISEGITQVSSSGKTKVTLDLVEQSNAEGDNVAYLTIQSTEKTEIITPPATEKLFKIVDGEGYPSGFLGYVASIGTNSNGEIVGFKVSNNAERWADSSTSNGPLYATRINQSITGKTGKPAVFGSSFPAGTPGKEFVNVEFLGFEAKARRTGIKIGNGVSGLNPSSRGGLEYPDWASGGTVYTSKIPFYLELSDTNSGGTFMLDGKEFWYSMRFATGAGTVGKTSSFDYDVMVKTGDFVNGRQWKIIQTTSSNGKLSIRDVAVGGQDNELSPGELFTIDGVTFRFERQDNGSSTISGDETMFVKVDVVLELREFNPETFELGPYIYNTQGNASNTSTYGLLFLSNDFTGYDLNVGLPNEFGIYYVPKYNTITGKLWLLLKRQPIITAAYSSSLFFHGTYLPDSDNELYSQLVKYYVPQNTDFEYIDQRFSDAETFFVADFTVKTPNNITNYVTDYNIFIDARDGGNLGPFPNSNLTYFSSDVDVVKFPNTSSYRRLFSLTSGSSTNFMQAAFTDFGTGVYLLGNDGGVGFSIPERAEKIDIVVKEKGAVTGGAGSKQYNVSLSSNIGSYELLAGLDGVNDVNALTDAQLPVLINQQITLPSGKLATVQEKIGVNVDAMFDTSSDIKDLVSKIGSGDFGYMVQNGSLSSGPGIEIGQCLPLFGRLYPVVDLQSSSSSPKSITFDTGIECAISEPPTAVCGNNICETSLGENSLNCTIDCGSSGGSG